MVKEIVHSPILLAAKSEPAVAADLQTVQDLLDTLSAHADECVGMAANMIGVRKRIIAFDNMGVYMTMLNPEIIEKSEPYEAKEGCLSFRYRKITVKWQTGGFRTMTKAFSGWTAQIIQHEIDHCDGILI